MSVSQKHPDITSARLTEWTKVEAASHGEEFVKQRGETFLPKPLGFNQQQDGGAAMYNAYLSRAQFPEWFEPTVSAMVGMIHDRNIAIEMPDRLKGILGKTPKGSSGRGVQVEEFHRMITRGLLIYGRYGVLAEAPQSGGEPFLVGHKGHCVINWDLDFFVLDESQQVRKDFIWSLEPMYRVLRLVDGRYEQELWSTAGNRLVQNAESPIAVSATGGAQLDFVPFYVGNAKEMTADIETPPLFGVATHALATYQLSADHRYQLYMSGQETLVAINGQPPTSVGAGVVHHMTGSDELMPDLKYVGPDCKGIEAHERAMDINKSQAAIAGARMLAQDKGTSQESGDARRLRFASETANILTVARTSCSLLESGLKAAAIMSGLNPDDVSVECPTDLLDRTLSAQEAKALFEIYEGGGMSFETYYHNLQQGGWARDSIDADEEFSDLEEEDLENVTEGDIDAEGVITAV